MAEQFHWVDPYSEGFPCHHHQQQQVSCLISITLSKNRWMSEKTSLRSRFRWFVGLVGCNHVFWIPIGRQRKNFFFFHCRPSRSIIINANQTCHNLNVFSRATNRNCSLRSMSISFKNATSCWRLSCSRSKTFWSWVLQYWTTYLSEFCYRVVNILQYC